MDSQGKLLDRKKITLGNTTYFNQLLQLKDGNFIVLGNSAYHAGNSTSDPVFVTISKFMPSLQFVWNRSFLPLNTYSDVYNILEDGDGSLFLNYVAGDNIFCLKTGVIKLDGQGNLLWLKEYEAPSQCVVGNTGSMTQDDRYLYLINWINGDASNQFIKVDKSSGLPVFTSRLLMPDAYQWRAGATIAMLGEKIVMKGDMSSLTNSSSRNTLVLLDKNGVVLKQQCFSVLDNQLGLTMLVTRNHEIVMSGGVGGYSYFIRLDSNLNILYSKKTVSPGVAERAIREDATGALLSIGFFYYSDPYTIDLSYKKFTYDGKLGSCFTDSLLLDTESHLVSQTPITSIATNKPLNLLPLPYKESSYSLQNAHLLCAKASGCSANSLQAPSSLCDTLVHVATVTRNAGCTLPVSFTPSNNNLKIISRTDSTVSFKMLQSGSTILVASVFTGCNWLRDSVKIKSSIGTQTFSLGSDTSICPGNTLILRPDTNYFSYTWNDGSTADTLKVTGPGTYFVTVTNACGNMLADTVVVRAAAAVFINIGPDKIKCNDEKVSLSAPAGFINYTWGPSYQLVSVSDSQVTVSPLQDISYFIRAEKTPGCFAFDTVMIKVNRSAPINLGADKSFCRGDSLLLDAGSDFTKYTWSTGAALQKITVFTKGIYYVSAANQFGCVSKDTMVVLNVFASPLVQLGNDFSLCKGSTQTLDAGTFSHYLWNDLSTNRTLQVNTTGLYAVKVADLNNCTGSDTIVVAGILPLPANFLPADTLLCQYETIQLAATGDFSSYLWNTNSVDKTIAVKSPGQYWLQVKDRNNCVGRDSIAISLKECVAGFYIPSAFTPNHDGLNDLFKPILLGNVLQYRFLIHNRYGQVVFETTDFKEGWNGKVNGIDQNSNGFTWVCWYLLQGSVAKTEKGNVMLLR
jgi:gliding motility-associated-like protein